MKDRALLLCLFHVIAVTSYPVVGQRGKPNSMILGAWKPTQGKGQVGVVYESFTSEGSSVRIPLTAREGLFTDQNNFNSAFNAPGVSGVQQPVGNGPRQEAATSLFAEYFSQAEPHPHSSSSGHAAPIRPARGAETSSQVLRLPGSLPNGVVESPQASTNFQLSLTETRQRKPQSASIYPVQSQKSFQPTLPSNVANIDSIPPQRQTPSSSIVKPISQRNELGPQRQTVSSGILTYHNSLANYPPNNLGVPDHIYNILRQRPTRTTTTTMPTPVFIPQASAQTQTPSGHYQYHQRQQLQQHAGGGVSPTLNAFPFPRDQAVWDSPATRGQGDMDSPLSVLRLPLPNFTPLGAVGRANGIRNQAQTNYQNQITSQAYGSPVGGVGAANSQAATPAIPTYVANSGPINALNALTKLRPASPTQQSYHQQQMFPKQTAWGAQNFIQPSKVLTPPATAVPPVDGPPAWENFVSFTDPPDDRKKDDPNKKEEEENKA